MSPNIKIFYTKTRDKLMPNSVSGVYKLTFSCGSVYNGEAKKKIISRSKEHQQESIKSNWSSSGATEHTMECHGNFDWLYPKTISIKNRYYDRKVIELLEIDMAVVRDGLDKVWNKDNGNFIQTNAWKPLFRKMETLHWNFTSFCIKWRFCLVFSLQYIKVPMPAHRFKSSDWSIL